MKKTVILTVICLAATIGISAQQNDTRYKVEKMLGIRKTDTPSPEDKRKERVKNIDTREAGILSPGSNLKEARSIPIGKGGFSNMPELVIRYNDAQAATKTRAATATVTKTVSITAGTLSSALSAEEMNTITDLTIIGTMDARDFKTVRDKINVLENLI